MTARLNHSRINSSVGIACSRLRDSRAGRIEKARIRKKNGRKLFLFFPPRPHFRTPYTLASSPLSESLEQAEWVKLLTAKRDVMGPIFKAEPILGLKGDVKQDNSQQRFLAQHSVASLLLRCFKLLQHCSNIAMLYCANCALIVANCPV